MEVDLSQYSFDSVAMNVVVAWLIQKAKLSDSSLFSWISEQTPRINAAVSVLMAAITAAGMAVSWQDSSTGHTLVVSGITAGSVGTFLWTVVKNIAFQHGAYKVMFQPKS